jgi:hypothetical protein
MGNWLCNQSTNYKKTNEIMKDELIRKKMGRIYYKNK